MKFSKKFVPAMAIVALLAGVASAEFISPTGVTVAVGTTHLGYPASYLIGGETTGLISGPSPRKHVTGTTSATRKSWLTSRGSGADYFNGRPNPKLVFDLGEDKLLSHAYLWATGYAGDGTTYQGNSAKDFGLRFNTASEGTTFSGLAELTGVVSHPPISSTATIARDDFSFGQTITARYVEMTITDNYYGEPNAAGGDRVSLGEVGFNVVPEPSMFVLAVIGLLGLGAFRFRKRRG